jgi:hypothetical protein
MQQFVGGESNRRKFFEEYEEIIDELVDGLVAEDSGEIDRAVRYSFAKGIGWSPDDLQRYVDEVTAYVEGSQVMDDYAGEMRGPDEGYMEKVESDIPFADDADEFRRKIHNKRTRTRKIPAYLNEHIEGFVDAADELRINGDLDEYETDLRTAIFREKDPRTVINEMTTRYDMPGDLAQTGEEVAREILEYRELPIEEQQERTDRQVRVTVQKDVMEIDELQEARTPQHWDEVFELESISFEPSDLVKTDEGTIAHSEAANYVEKTERNLQEFFNFTPQSAELISQEIFKRRAGQDVDVDESLIQPNVQKYKSQ